MIRLDEAIAVVAQMKARSAAIQYLNGDSDLTLHTNLGLREAKALAIVYETTNVDSIASELDRDIRRRFPIEVKKLRGVKTNES